MVGVAKATPLTEALCHHNKDVKPPSAQRIHKTGEAYTTART